MSTPQPVPYDPLGALAAQQTAPTQAYDPVGDMAAGKTTSSSTAQPSWMEENVERPLGLAGRAVASGVAGLPLMAMDAGVASRNLIGDWANKELGQPASQDYELPSKEFQDALTQAGFPTPSTPIEKGTSLVESALSGGKLTNPEAGGIVPENFQSPEQALLAGRFQGVKNGLAAGYRIPPATSNPTATNRAVETVGGDIATRQLASRLNQPVTNRLAAQALGLDPRVPITTEALSHVRATAAQDYEAIAKVGPIKLDDAFKKALGGITEQSNATAAELPSLAKNDLQPVADDLAGKDQLSGRAFLGAVRGLRDKADQSFRAGDSGTGMAYKGMARELENSAQRDLSSRGAQYAPMLQAFKAARQKIAMAHSVEDALNPATSNVLAPKLGAALARGEPLSGPLRTIAEFAKSAPKAVQEPTSSQVSHLDIVPSTILGAAGELAHGIPAAAAAAAAYPAARMGARWWAMGPGQASALPEIAASTAPAWARGAPGAYEGSQESDGK